jgi:hypothetical protein
MGVLVEPRQLDHEPAKPSGPSHLRLGELLIRRGLIEQDDLALALALQGLDDSNAHLGCVLVELGAITEETLVAALAEQSGLSVTDPRAVTPDAQLLARMSREAALRFGALPLTRCEQAVVVAVAEPPTREFRHDLSRRLQAHLEFVLATPDALGAAIDRSFPPRTTPVTDVDTSDPFDVVPSTGIRFEPGPELIPRTRVSREREPHTADPGTAPAPEPAPMRSTSRTCALDAGATSTTDRTVARLIHQATEAGASALHLVSEPDGLQVRLRVNGTMRDELDLPAAAAAILLERIATAAGFSVEKAETMRRGTLWSDDAGFGPELSVAWTPTRSGHYVVIHPAEPAPSTVDCDIPALSEARHALANLMTETRRGVVLVACSDRTRRRAILANLATDSIMDTRSVGCAGLGTERALPGVNHFDPLGELDPANLARTAREFDHDVIVIDVDHNNDLLGASFNVGNVHALVIAGVNQQHPADALAHTCDSVNPLLVASGLALIIAIAQDGETELARNYT